MKLRFQLRLHRISAPIAFAVICISAFATRLMPLAFSQYPFNNDSLTECGLASDIILSGSLEYSQGSPWEGTHSVDTPAFNVLIAYASLMLAATPVGCAQIVTAVLSILTVGAVFLLGRLFSGTTTGGIIASMIALLSGTFVFTTGSTWKLSLGFALIALLYFAFVRRNLPQHRALAFCILCLLPFVHHLAAVIALVALGFMLIWSWIVALSKSKVTRRLWEDTLTILPPAIVASLYYSIALADRQDIYDSGVRIASFVGIFLLLSMIAYFVMSLRKHKRISFGPLVGAVFVAIMLLDYLGFVFPYEASAPSIYIVLIISTAVLLTIAWYGTELVIENKRRLAAVQLSLVVAPMTVILFGIGVGLPNLGHQVVYRTFDFLQFFIFIGIGVAFIEFKARRPKVYRLATVVIVTCLACSFPFGFFTNELLGVRRDTQAYEIDSMISLSKHADNPKLVSDERLAFMARSTIWVEKRSTLPNKLVLGDPLLPDYYYLIEDSWTETGVNNFPNGLALIDKCVVELVLERSDVMYVGGPAEDRLHVFTSENYISYAI